MVARTTPNICKMNCDNDKIVFDRQAQWRELKVKLDIILRTNKLFNTDESQAKCLYLNDLSKAERMAYILENWGQLYLDKVTPLLLQLEALEAPV